MPKQHPTTLILIEPASFKLWRVVERETTFNGVSRYNWREIEGNMASYPEARAAFDKVKGFTPTN
jgi:hypothetical protein